MAVRHHFSSFFLLNLPFNLFLHGTRKTRKSGLGYTKSVTTIPSFLEKKIRRIPRKGNWEWWVTRIDGNVFIIFIPWFRVSISSFRWFIEVLLCSIFERGNFQFFFKILILFYVTRFTECQFFWIVCRKIPTKNLVFLYVFLLVWRNSKSTNILQYYIQFSI